MAAPTGLYSWIKSNNGRSTGLFLGFILTVQVLAPLALSVPLIVVDVDHAPFLDWMGYLHRYALVVLIASIAWFAAQLWWHMETVKRAVGFRFIDDQDEPRLCRAIEPLVILMGLPVPFVGVIENDARNAFACGIARRKAVVVVTRGLLDALDDAELEAVLAHELSHVRNGDIRLMAAANIFMATLGRLHASNLFRFTPVHGLVALAVPAVLPLSIAGSLIGRIALRAGQASRLLIASSREFVADAQAAEWTRNPAALAAALLKVDGRHRLAVARGDEDAMMIAGDSHGPHATHPTVAQRIAALTRVTGSMVFNAPGAPGDALWTATASRAAVDRVRLGRGALALGALVRIRRGRGQNVLGLTRLGTASLLATLAGLAALHPGELGDAHALAARFDLRPLGMLARTPIGCEAGPLMLVRLRCDRPPPFVNIGRPRMLPAAPDPVRQLYRGQSGRLVPTTVPRTADGMYVDQDGGERFGVPEPLVIAETDRVGCFVRDPRPIERTGPLPLDRVGPSGQSIAGLRHDAAELAREVQASRADASMLGYYVERRENLIDEIYAIYGRPGLAAAQAIFADEPSAAALERLRWIASTMGTIRDLPSVQQAKLRSLLRDPDAFVPCRALQTQLRGADPRPESSKTM